MEDDLRMVKTIIALLKYHGNPIGKLAPIWLAVCEVEQSLEKQLNCPACGRTKEN